MPSADFSGAAGGAAELAPQINPTSSENQRTTVLTWNVEWLGDDTNGPEDEARQLTLAIDGLGYADADLVGLQEVSSAASAARLAQAFPAYGLELAHYAQRQKLALLYRASRFELLHISAVEGLDDAGRPPLEARLRTARGRELTVIVVHAKAGGDPSSYQTRRRFAAGLSAYLEHMAEGREVIVLGDFNDLFGSSTLQGARSPYEALTASGAYVAVTQVLETGAERSTRWGATVDHIVLSRSLVSRVLPDSVETLRDELLARHADFFEAASDHAPVTLELTL